MLKLKDIGRARRSAGAAALAVLCAGVGLGAWAAQPAEVRIAIGPADNAQIAQPTRADVVTPRPERMAARDDLGAQASSDGAPPDAAAATIVAARSDVSPTPDRAVTETAAVSSPSVQEIALLQTKQASSDAGAGDVGRLRLSELEARQPDDGDTASAAEQVARQGAPGTMKVAGPTEPAAGAHKRAAAGDLQQQICWNTTDSVSRQRCMTEKQSSEMERRQRRLNLDLGRSAFPASTTYINAGAMAPPSPIH